MYLKLILFVILASNTFENVQSANILGIFPLGSSSHYVMFDKIMKALCDRGHNLDIVGHFPNIKYPRYNVISIYGTQKMFVNNLTVDEVRHMSLVETLNFISTPCGTESCRTTLEHPDVIALKNTTKKYDLVLTEIFSTDCMVGFGYHFKVPVISFTSSMNMPWGSDRVANPDNPAYVPHYLSPYTTKMTFYERFYNTISLVTAKVMYNFISMKGSNELAKEFFGPDMPDIQDLVYNTSLLLVNSHFSMNPAIPKVPNFIEVGGVHIDEPKPLPEHFEKLVKTDSEGVILLTMGSMLLTETFPKEKTQALFDALSELPYKVIWKADKDKFPEGLRFAKNVHFEKWVPQLDLLCNKNIKLFISHGGLMGSQEAVYCGVPRLAIPFFVDQQLNVRQAEGMGLVIKVAFNEITKEKILHAARELLYNPKYRQNVDLASRIFRDRPISARDEAVYWIEYVMRYNGAPHLQSEAVRLMWYQYYLLDVIAVLLIIVSVPLFVLYYIVKSLLRRLCTNKSKSSKKSKQS